MRALFLLLLVAAAPASAQQYQCEVNGVTVNPANGNSTQGKTGIMKCLRGSGADSRLQREQEIRNGKFIGLERFYSDDGTWTEHNINERGNRDGRARTFFADGKVKLDEMMANGSNAGLSTRYYPNGQPERQTFYEDGREIAAIDYRQDGKLARLRCAARPVIAEDRVPCGFDHQKSDITLYGPNGNATSKESWRDGILVSRIELDAAGAPRRSLTVENGVRTTRDYFKDGKVRLETAYREGTANLRTGPREGTEKEWSAEGQQIRETVWRNGYRSDVTQWYMNGNLKEKMHADSGERNAKVTTERYSDTGKLQSKEVAQGRQLVGTQQAFAEDGTLQYEALYDERGVMTGRKEYDAAGKVLKEEAFFADGSRKLK